VDVTSEGKLSDYEECLLAAYTVQDGSRDPDTFFDQVWAFGQAEARDDTLLCGGVTDTLHQAPLVVKFSDEAQNLASPQAKLVRK
jgi:hypothetical protein